MNLEKLKSMTIDELSMLKERVNEIVLRTHITGAPSNKWKDFNALLSTVNKLIEDRIYDEYFK